MVPAPRQSRLLLICLLLLPRISTLFAQVNLDWEARFGGTCDEYAYSIVETWNAEYIVAGHSSSDSSAEKSSNSKGLFDFWAVQFDIDTGIVWDVSFGGDDQEVLNALLLLPDSSILMVGSSLSGQTGDKSQPSHGDWDYWLVKADSSGSKIWDRRFGGTDADMAFTAVVTHDSCILVGGISKSGMNGDKSQSSWGGFDTWLVKIDLDGNKVWDKRFGGSRDDILPRITVTSDNCFILAAWSQSPMDGDLSQDSIGNGDFWIIKLDQDGNKVWDVRMGGTEKDVTTACRETPDSLLLIGGWTESDTFNNLGNRDAWLTKIRTNGSIVWQRTFGGSDEDAISDVNILSNGNYALSGYTRSSMDGHIMDATRGQVDYWIMIVDSTGSIITEYNIGGNSADVLTSTLNGQNGLIHAGYTKSSPSGEVSGSKRGGIDYWIFESPSCLVDSMLYVDSTATGADDGSSWTNAYTSFADALHEALYCDNIFEIWVAKGTYYPGDAARDSSFEISSNLSVYGGFNGTETEIAQRDVAGNKTILSGDIGMTSDSTDNSFHVVKIPHDAQNVILDGFSISLGTANGITIPQQSGAGVLCLGSAKIANCIFDECTSAGIGNTLVIIGPDAHLTLEDCSLYGVQLNTALVRIATGATLIFNNSIEIHE